MHRKIVAILVLAAAGLLMLASAAPAASPQDIYNDYVTDGRLDGPYTQTEIDAYLNDATVRQYGDVGTLGSLDALLKGALPYLESGDTLSDALAKAAAGEQSGRSRFPFTGLPLAALALGVLGVVGGMALRRPA
ncbi:MAG: hypothetical protein KKA32_13720 [Actinobacteria bacterium]|nr:hypothetical protein [Actinomycetota bacterium]